MKNKGHTSFADVRPIYRRAVFPPIINKYSLPVYNFITRQFSSNKVFGNVTLDGNHCHA
jgi:hypothetical protein